MIVLLPSETPAEASEELAAIRTAGERLLSSVERRRAFLDALGFRPRANEVKAEPSAEEGGE